MNQKTLWQIFRWPLLIALISIVGLISALVGDGWWDALSWATLGLPALWFSVWCLRPWVGTRCRPHPRL